MTDSPVRTYVLDTSVLLSDPWACTRFAEHEVVVPLVVISELIMLVCCVLLFRGTWMQHEVNATTASLVTGMPLIWVFGIAYVTSAGIAVLILHKLWRIATGQATDKDIFGAAAQASEGDAP